MQRLKKQYQVVFVSNLFALAALFCQTTAVAACADDWLGVEEVRDGGNIGLRATNLREFPITFTLRVRTRDLIAEGKRNRKFAEVGRAQSKVTDIVHIETQPPEFTDMRDRVKRNLRHLVYRPRLEQGKLVKSPDITFTHEFFYRPEDLPAMPSEAKSTQ